MSCIVVFFFGEGEIGKLLIEVQKNYFDMLIGFYFKFDGNGFYIEFVVRVCDEVVFQVVVVDVEVMFDVICQVCDVVRV